MKLTHTDHCIYIMHFCVSLQASNGKPSDSGSLHYMAPNYVSVCTHACTHMFMGDYNPMCYHDNPKSTHVLCLPAGE